MFSWTEINCTLFNDKTPCLSNPVESIQESFSMKIWSVKSFPGEKHRLIDSPQWIFEFHQMCFDITPVISLIPFGVWQYLSGIMAVRDNSSPGILG